MWLFVMWDIVTSSQLKISIFQRTYFISMVFVGGSCAYSFDPFEQISGHIGHFFFNYFIGIYLYPSWQSSMHCLLNNWDNERPPHVCGMFHSHFVMKTPKIFSELCFHSQVAIWIKLAPKHTSVCWAFSVFLVCACHTIAFSIVGTFTTVSQEKGKGVGLEVCFVPPFYSSVNVQTAEGLMLLKSTIIKCCML